MHTYIHTHTYTHTYIHTHSYIYSYIHRHTYIHTYTYTHYHDHMREFFMWSVLLFGIQFDQLFDFGVFCNRFQIDNSITL